MPHHTDHTRLVRTIVAGVVSACVSVVHGSHFFYGYWFSQRRA